MQNLRGATTPVLLANLSPIIVVASTGEVYTKSFPLFNGEYFGVWLSIASILGAADIKIDLEQSWKPPTTEGVAETALYQVTQAVSAQINTEATAQVIKILPIPMAWGRYKITGLGSNPADTIVTAYNFIQE